MSFKNELVLSLVQPHLTNKADHVNSQLASKYLNKTGSENPNRPLPPLGVSLQRSRNKKDRVRLEKYSSKFDLKQIYLESELQKIHVEIMKFENYDILDINSSVDYLKEGTFNCGVECGVFIPVMYPRQREPVWSMIYAGKKHTLEDAKVFIKDLEKLKIYGKFHGGLNDINIESTKLILQSPDIKDHPNYKKFVTEVNSPRPFDFLSTTQYFRWCDLHSNKKHRVTYG